MDLTIANAHVWAAPDEPLTDPQTIVIRDGIVSRIDGSAEAVGRVVDIGGRVVTAGFWNCHVHLPEPVWRGARGAASADLQTTLDDMFLSRGFTTVLDLSSDPRTTLALARRIEARELPIATRPGSSARCTRRAWMPRTLCDR